MRSRVGLGFSVSILVSLMSIAAHAGPETNDAPSKAAPEPEAFWPDRPGNANAPTSVSADRAIIETSIDVGTSGGISELRFPTALRFGLLPRFEVRLLSSLFAVRFENDDTRTDFTDISAGMKLWFLDNDGWLPHAAMSADISLPTGGEGFGNDSAVPDARALIGWSLPANFSLLLNVGFDAPQDTGQRRARLLHVVNLSYTLPVLDGRLGVGAETFGQHEFEGQTSPFQIDAAATFLATEEVQLDLFLQFGLTDASPDFQLGLGLSVRI